MFKLAIQWGWRLDNPVSGVLKYKEFKRHRWLDNEEVKRLFSVLDTYHSQNVDTNEAVAADSSAVVMFGVCCNRCMQNRVKNMGNIMDCTDMCTKQEKIKGNCSEYDLNAIKKYK